MCIPTVWANIETGHIVQAEIGVFVKLCKRFVLVWLPKSLPSRRRVTAHISMISVVFVKLNPLSRGKGLANITRRLFSTHGPSPCGFSDRENILVAYNLTPVPQPLNLTPLLLPTAGGLFPPTGRGRNVCLPTRGRSVGKGTFQAKPQRNL